MAHKNETMLRTAYAAFAKGDVAGYFEHCTPDISFRIPGNQLVGGTHSKDQFLAILGPAMQAIGGTFREEVQRVVANDDFAAVLVSQQAERDGKLHRWNAVHYYRIVNGRLAEFWEFVDDQHAFDAAWHR
jgi:ketosteroid isomerase-like protein